jgi:hypothetical protein
MLYNDDKFMNEGEDHSEQEKNKPNSDIQKSQQGTADNDGKNNDKPNIPGPLEVPDQQKVGEDNDEKYHIET